MLGQFSRRSLLTGGLGAAAGLAFPALRPSHRGNRGEGKQGKPLRIAYLTDTHLKVCDDARVRFGRCLDQVQRQEKPDIIIQGGDIILDALDFDRGTAQAHFDLAGRMLRDHVSTPIYHCIGNHDVWGWNRGDRQALLQDPHYGKQWWHEWTGYDRSYYSFDRGGWHFVFLDSISPKAGISYKAKLDDAQFEWLANDLEHTNPNTPVCVVSHVPILSIAAQFFGPSERSGNRWEISGSLMHLDSRRIKDLFVKHPNVKLCLSGHIHMNSHVKYANVAHVSFGAVSGAWWNGDMQETKPGYGVVDLYASGHFHTDYVTY